MIASMPPLRRSSPLVHQGPLALVLILALAGMWGCEPSGSGGSQSLAVTVRPAQAPRALNESLIPAVRFQNITETAGIRFRHTNGAFGKRLLPETMGSGGAFVDYDQDGDQDLLLINSCYWPGHEPSNQPAPTMALYRNRGDGTFDDVTVASGLAMTMYGMGVTVGDYDNDGWDDLFVTGVGSNRLFANVAGEQGTRRFVDRTEAAGVAGPGGWPTAGGEEFLKSASAVNYSSSATFMDFDNDGRLDLFVCNYVNWSPAADLSQDFTLVGLGRSYGPPTAFEGAQCLLYRNLGGGKFADVSRQAGVHVLGPIGQAIGKSLGVIALDADDDGWTDLVVANDTVRNFLFHNTGRGSFEEVGELSGVAYAEGRTRGAMGIDWGEYRPGVSAVIIGNFSDEPNTLLRLDDPGRLLFSDVAVAEGLAGPSRMPLKFGALFLDYDLDGRQDLLTCNGNLEPEIQQVQSSQTYRQAAQLFWNCGPGRSDGHHGCFAPVSGANAGPDLFEPLVGRACAYADVDGDGDLDLLLTENGGPARLLRNEGGNRQHWLRVVLRGDGKKSNSSAIGAKLTLEAGGQTLRRELNGARGYLSQSELAVTFGLGKTSKVDRLTIRWPGADVGVQTLTDLAVDRVHVIRQ